MLQRSMREDSFYKVRSVLTLCIEESIMKIAKGKVCLERKKRHGTDNFFFILLFIRVLVGDCDLDRLVYRETV